MARAATIDADTARPNAGKAARLDLFGFVPFRLNRLAAEVSNALSDEYQARYGLDIPEWRVLATLGFRNDACSAQYISDCTRTHKSTISRAVTALMERQIVERVENAEDRREFRLRLTRKGRALYEELIPRLLRKEQEFCPASLRTSARISPRCSARSSRASRWCRPARKRMRKKLIEALRSVAGLLDMAGLDDDAANPAFAALDANRDPQPLAACAQCQFADGLLR